MNANKAEIRARYEKVDTATVADVLDELGLPNQALSPEFRPLSGSRLAGWAYTIDGHSKAGPGGGDPRKMKACGEIGQDQVAVWGGDGRGVAYFGELIATGMAESGCVGAVVNGGVRDVRWLNDMAFPAFGTYRTPVQSIGRFVVDSWQRPTNIPGATSAHVVVNPDDFVLADDDGVVIVPGSVALAVLNRAEELTHIEVEIRRHLTEGSTLADVLERFGHV